MHKPVAPQRAQVLALALLGLPMALATLPFALHVPNLYTQGLGLSLASVGAVLLLVRLGDLLLDPLVGALVDRRALWNSHRKSWVALACLPVSVGAYQVLRPPDGADMLYLALWSTVFYAGWTLMSIPYQSWAAELSADYHQRARVRAWIEALTTVGTIAAAAAPLLAAGNTRQGMQWLGLALALAFPACVAVALWRVPEPPLVGHARQNLGSEWKALRHAWDNPHFARLGVAYTVNGLGDALSAVVVLYFIDHVIGSHGRAGLFLGCLFGAALLAVPFWAAMSHRYGKHRAWRWSLVWGGLCFAGIPFLGRGDDLWYLALCIGGGIAFAADAVLPPAMLADVVDADTARWRVQRTAMYFALWAILTKLALALPTGLALPLLQWAGFDARTGGTEQGRLAVSLLYGLGPLVCRAVALFVMRSYALDAPKQAQLRREIERMDTD